MKKGDNLNPIPASLLEGTVIIESTGDLERLKQRLEKLFYWPLAPGCLTEIWVVCKEKVYPPIELLLRQYDRTIILLALPAEPGVIIGSYLLTKVRSEKVAFFPEDSAFCFPCWKAIDQEGSIIPLVGHVEYPSATAWIRQKYADGWLCRTRTAVKHLSSTHSLEEWKAAEIFKNGSIPILSPLPLTPLTGESMPEIVSKNKNARLITSRSRVMAIVPHYKCEKWLFQCLESLVNQTRPPDAVVVVDDNSLQPPIDIVKHFPTVTLMTTHENVGPYLIIQQVIDNSDFDVFMFQDADDWSSADRLASLLKEAERTGAQLVGSQELKVICRPSGAAKVHQLQPVCYPLDVNRALREKPGHALLHPTSIVSRDLVQQVGGFATGLRFGGDTEFLFRAVYLASIVNIPRFCYFRRHRAGSLTTAAHSGFYSPARKELLVLLKKRARENMARSKNGCPLLLQPLKQRSPVELKHLCGPHWIIPHRPGVT